MTTKIKDDINTESSDVFELDPDGSQSILSEYDRFSQKHKLYLDTNNSFENNFEYKEYLTQTGLIDRKDKHEQFIAEQKFECQVTEVYNSECLFKAVDTEGKEKDFEYKFQKNDVPQEDRNLIEAGAIFYWSIGYFESSSTVSKQIEIRFRRVVDWTDEDKKNALNDADNLMDELGWPRN